MQGWELDQLENLHDCTGLLGGEDEIRCLPLESRQRRFEVKSFNGTVIRGYED